jgi:hypothetical protein
MKKLILLLILSGTLFSTGCEKQEEENDCLADLIITKVTYPLHIISEPGITFVLDCYGPNLCYSFSEVQVKNVGANTFEIKAKATVPCEKDLVCAQAIYEAQPAKSILNLAPGNYTLRFFNGNSLFKEEVVRVN